MKSSTGSEAVQIAESDLSSVLSTGPFHAALRAAVRARGLTLERLRSHLGRRGIAVGISSLSDWQHGRSRPGPGSLPAVYALEQLLGLRADSLVRLLVAPDPEGTERTGTPPASSSPNCSSTRCCRPARRGSSRSRSSTRAAGRARRTRMASCAPRSSTSWRSASIRPACRWTVTSSANPACTTSGAGSPISPSTGTTLYTCTRRPSAPA